MLQKRNPVYVEKVHMSTHTVVGAWDLLLQWLPYLPLEDSTLQSKLPGVLEWLKLKEYISSYNNNKLLITLGGGNTHQVIRFDLNHQMLMGMPPLTRGFYRLDILGYAICRVNEPNAQELLNDYITRVRACAMVNAYRRMDYALPHRWRKGLNVNVDAVFDELECHTQLYGPLGLTWLLPMLYAFSVKHTTLHRRKQQHCSREYAEFREYECTGNDRIVAVLGYIMQYQCVTVRR